VRFPHRAAALIALQRQAQHLGLALRAIEVHRLAGRGLGDADQLREARALIQQGMNSGIDGIDAVADIAETAAGGSDAGRTVRQAFARPFRSLPLVLFLTLCHGRPSCVPTLEVAHELDQRLDAGSGMAL
jgi:hypothetical protein